MVQAVELHLSDHGKNLYIFFGGIAAGIAMPVFEFYNASRILDEHKLFFRDLSQCWYQDGLPGISRDISATADYIRSQINQIEPEKLFFVGNSMGGYAAIMFATLIGAGEVIAFAPQTFISPLPRIKHRDFRWQKQIINTYRKSVWKQKAWDLRSLLRGSLYAPRISVFVSRSHRLDRIHARHLAGITGVRIHEFDGGGHGVVKLLRDEGKLPAIMLGTYAAEHDQSQPG